MDKGRGRGKGMVGQCCKGSKATNPMAAMVQGSKVHTTLEALMV